MKKTIKHRKIFKWEKYRNIYQVTKREICSVEFKTVESALYVEMLSSV